MEQRSKQAYRLNENIIQKECVPYQIQVLIFLIFFFTTLFRVQFSRFCILFGFCYSKSEKKQQKEIKRIETLVHISHRHFCTLTSFYSFIWYIVHISLLLTLCNLYSHRKSTYIKSVRCYTTTHYNIIS